MAKAEGDKATTLQAENHILTETVISLRREIDELKRELASKECRENNLILALSNLGQVLRDRPCNPTTLSFGPNILDQMACLDDLRAGATAPVIADTEHMNNPAGHLNSTEVMMRGVAGESPDTPSFIQSCVSSQSQEPFVFPGIVSTSAESASCGTTIPSFVDPLGKSPVQSSMFDELERYSGEFFEYDFLDQPTS